MTISAAAERHKNNFEEYLEKFEQAEAEQDVRAMRHNLKRAIDYWMKYTECSDSPTIRQSRMDNLETLLELFESLPESADQLPGAKGSGQRQNTEGKDSESEEFDVAQRPTMRFSDIAGLESVKQEVRVKMLYPFTHPEEAERFRIKRGGGVLLYGPPGTGKTMMAKAIAGEIEAAFFSIKPSDIMHTEVGESEARVERLFKQARSHPISIIFIDEIEALIPARDGGKVHGMFKRLVPQILAELEGFETDGQNPLLFLGATNEPWALDPAVLRPGRFDIKVYVGLPDVPARERLLEIGFKKRPIASNIDFADLAEGLEGFSGADIINLCEKAAAQAFMRRVKESRGEDTITAEDIVTVLNDLSPSVTPANLKRFHKYRDSH